MGPLGPPRAPKMKVLRPGRYSNGFLTQFCSGLVVSDPKSDHPDPFWLIIRQKTDFLYLFPSSVDCPGGENLFFPIKNDFVQMLGQNMIKKKLRYDPRDPSRKIRSEILVKFRV